MAIVLTDEQRERIEAASETYDRHRTDAVHWRGSAWRFKDCADCVLAGRWQKYLSAMAYMRRIEDEVQPLINVIGRTAVA